MGLRPVLEQSICPSYYYYYYYYYHYYYYYQRLLLRHLFSLRERQIKQWR